MRLRPPVSGFTGFRPGVAAFFDGLRQDNSKAWFDAHRAEWTELVKAPMEALLAEAEARYGSGRVMRQNRDVRFSADKTPYRLSSSLWAGTIGGVYLQVSAQGLQAGGGLYEPSRDQLARARAVIDERPQAAAALQRVVDELADHGYELAGPSLATAPRGFPRDHPHIGLLRLRHYAGLTTMPLGSGLPRILAAWEQVEPLNRWVGKWVGPAQQWP